MQTIFTLSFDSKSFPCYKECSSRECYDFETMKVVSSSSFSHKIDYFKSNIAHSKFIRLA